MMKETGIEFLHDSPGAGGMSPRLSFSHNLLQNDAVEHYIPSSSSSSSIDFDFCVACESSDQVHSSFAEELFSDGKILPVDIKKTTLPPPPPPPPPPRQTQKCPVSSDKPSFWGFKRSASLNCGNGYARTLFPLPPLLRSNSTGSNPIPKRSNNNNNNNQKQNLVKKQSSSSSANHQKPPLKKSNNNNHGYYSNGAKVISPVLNLPPANLFGLGSIFSGGGKDRRKKK